MKRKTVSGRVEFKAAEGETGQFRAVFSTLGVKDADGDVTLPGAFTNGQPVRISYWGHRWENLPVGKGVINANEVEAWVDGQFFMDTDAGHETYLTAKGLGDLQQWSYGYEIEDAMPGDLNGEQVQFLKRLNVIEVSPVMLGAGVNTRTTDIKAGARHTSKEFEQIQQIHDLAVGLGAKCAEPAADDSDGDGDGDGKGKARKGKPSEPARETFAVRIAAELIEEGITTGD